MTQRSEVLVLDGDMFIIDLLEDILAEEGYPVRCATSLSEMLHQMRDFTPSLLLVDAHMPGVHFERLRSLFQLSNVCLPPVIVMATHEEHAHSFLDAGAKGCVLKPFDIETLLNTLTHVQEKARRSYRAAMAVPTFA